MHLSSTVVLESYGCEDSVKIRLALTVCRIAAFFVGLGILLYGWARIGLIIEATAAAAHLLTAISVHVYLYCGRLLVCSCLCTATLATL